MFVAGASLNIIRLIVVALAYLAGLIAAIILLTRKKGTPAILAAVGFGLGFLQQIGAILQGTFLSRMLYRQVDPASARYVGGGLNCCCGLFGVAAVVCLIIAIWQALSERALAADEIEASGE